MPSTPNTSRQPMYATRTSAPIPVEAKQAGVMARQKSRNARLLSVMIAAYNEGIKDIWNNPDGLNPNQAFQGYGTEGVETLRRATILKTAINGAEPGTIPDMDVYAVLADAQGNYTRPTGAVAGKPVIVSHPDGTVTVDTVPA